MLIFISRKEERRGTILYVLVVYTHLLYWFQISDKLYLMSNLHEYLCSQNSILSVIPRFSETWELLSVLESQAILWHLSGTFTSFFCTFLLLLAHYLLRSQTPGIIILSNYKEFSISLSLIPIKNSNDPISSFICSMHINWTIPICSIGCKLHVCRLSE